jgi:Cu2+-containing amine oxidase
MPVSRGSWQVEDQPGDLRSHTVFWRSRVEHADAWLPPIRPGDVDADEARDVVVRIEKKEASPVAVTEPRGDMSDLKAAASLRDRIDEAIRRMDRERDGG